jgi:predicted nucleotidyltransferase
MLAALTGTGLSWVDTIEADAGGKGRQKWQGNQLVTNDEVCGIAWLDPASQALLRASIAAAAHEFPKLTAAVLYGSIARQKERPLTDRYPSDIDVLLVFDRETVLDYHERTRMFRALGEALGQHLDAPREVQMMFATRKLAEWDETFVEHVAREGPLPVALAPVPRRAEAAAAT